MPTPTGQYRQTHPDTYRALARLDGATAKILEIRTTDDRGRLLTVEFPGTGKEIGTLLLYADAVSSKGYEVGGTLQFRLTAKAREITVRVGDETFRALYLDNRGVQGTRRERADRQSPALQRSLKTAADAAQKKVDAGVPVESPLAAGSFSLIDNPPIQGKDSVSQEEAQLIREAQSLAVEKGTAADPGRIDAQQDVWLGPPIPLPQAAEEAYYPEGYVRIGYVTFTVGSVVEDISVRRASPFESQGTLRSRTPIQKGNTHAALMVTFNMVFDSPDAMNQVLLPLVRLFRRAPFLPVVNTYLNDQGISALALQGLNLATVPEFPNALQVTLTCWAFNWHNYLPTAESLDAQFCYPLLKLWAESPRDREGGVGRALPLPEFQPFDGYWNGVFQLRHATKEWLQATNEFPLAANRATAWNADLEVLQQAAGWESIGARPDRAGPANSGLYEGWNQIRPGQGAERFGELREFVGPAGTLPTTVKGIPGHYVFLKLRSPELVERFLGGSPEEETVYVFKGQLQAEMRPGESLDGAGGTVSPSGWKLTGNRVDLADFLALLHGATDPTAPNDKGVEYSLRSGYYTLVFPAGHPALKFFRTGLRPGQVGPPHAIRPLEVPKDPGQVQLDQEETFAPPSLVVESITASVENVLAPLQIRGEPIPTHQYLGSTALVYQIQGTIANASEAVQCMEFLESLNALAREFPGRLSGTPFGGFAEVDNELFRFLGTRRVIPMLFDTQTLPEFPGARAFQLILVEFDETQRSRELLQPLMQDLEKGRKAADGVDHAVTSIFDGFHSRYLRQAEINRRLRTTDLYPDLGLPTHLTLARWLKAIREDRVWDWEQDRPFPEFSFLAPSAGGTGWQWVATGRPTPRPVVELDPQTLQALSGPSRLDRWAEPDFYCSPSLNWGRDLVDRVMGQATKVAYEFMDSHGATIQLKPGENLAAKVAAKAGLTDPQQTVELARESARQSRERQVGGATGDTALAIVPRAVAYSRFDQFLHGGARSAPEGYTPYGDRLNFSSNGLVPKSTNVPAPNSWRGKVPRSTQSTVERRFADYKQAIIQIALADGIDPALLAAVVHHESAGFQSRAVSQVGAQGLAQTMPATQREIARKLGWGDNWDPFDPGTSLVMAAFYLREQLQTFGNVTLALAAYNAGPGAVRRYHGVPPYRQTQHYVTEIRDRLYPYYRQRLGATGQELELSRVERQLQSLLEQGYGYPKEALTPYIDWPRSSIREDRERPTAPGAWINPNWIFEYSTVPRAAVPKVDEFGNIVDDPRDSGQRFYTIREPAIGAFIRAAKAHGFSLLPTAPPANSLKFRGDNKEVYQYSQATDLRTLAPPTTPLEAFYDPQSDTDMFHDLRREFIMGRLLGAFPTFYVAIIDGGRSLRVWRLFDHIYGMLAITRLQIHRTRKGPVETATVGFSNMYGGLTAQAYETARIQDDLPHGVWNAEYVSQLWSSFFQITDETVNAWAQHVNSLVLKAGARLHIRLGYGSDASQLPVVFNGTITEVPLSEGEVTVVAQSDGIELMNDMPPNAAIGSIPVTRYNSYLGGGLNPRDLMMLLLDPAGKDWVKGTATSLQLLLGKTVGSLFFPTHKNEFGIEHFGNPIREFMNSRDGELGVNLYNPVHASPLNRTEGWENLQQIFLLWDWKESSPLMGVQMSGATPWSVFETCRMTIPDYVLYPVPVDFRSTLFMGKAWFPLYGNYLEAIDDLPDSGDPNALPEKYFQRKAFQQVHLLHSSWNLIGNEVRADRDGVWTQVQAVGTYNGWLPGTRDMGVENSSLMELDSDIYVQRAHVVESGLYTTMEMKLQEAFSVAKLITAGVAIGSGIGLLLLGASEAILTLPTVIGGVIGAGTALVGASAITAGVAILFGPVAQMLQSRRILDYYAAMVLKDSVKDMYQGPLVLLGSGWIKPYDFCHVQDLLSQLNGPCEVKEVIHTFSGETGFITEVIPDALVSYVDLDGQELNMWLSMSAAQLGTGIASYHLLGAIARRTSASAGGAAIRGLRTWLAEELKANGPAIETLGRGRAEQALNQLDDLIDGLSGRKWRGLRQELQDVTERIRLGRPSVNQTRLSEALKEIASEDGSLRDVYDAAPRGLRTRIGVTRGLREGMGVVTDTTHKMVGKIKDFAHTAVSSTAQRAQALIARMEQQFAEAETKLQEIRRSYPDIEKLAKGAQDELDDAAKKAVSEFTAARRAQSAATTTIRSVERIAASANRAASMGPAALRWLSTAVGRTVTRSAVAGGVLAAIDGLAQWAIRAATARQCLVIWPLRIGDKEFTAGIEGHRGAVAGDSVSDFDQLLLNVFNFGKGTWWGGLIPFISTLAEADLRYQHPDLSRKLNEDLKALQAGEGG